jgi:type II secretory pathway pseudopilin PulG
MEGSATVLIVLAVLGAAGAVVAFVVQEVVRASGIGVSRTRLGGILEAMESVVYDTPRPAGSYAIGSGDPWGDRGPQSIEDARNVLLQVIAEIPVEHLAGDAAMWRRVQRMLAVSRPAPGRPPGPPPPSRAPTR